MIQDLNDFSIYRSVLCLNGDLPPRSFFLQMNQPLIAVDGAANTLIKLGITPSIIIGDLDSAHPEIVKKHPYLHLPDQNTSDYQKSLEYLQRHDLLPALVVGVNGGYLDHVLQNINLFMQSDCLLYAPPLKGFVLKAKTSLSLKLPLNTKMSLFGIPEATLSSKGLKWDLDETHLTFPGTSSCFNRTLSSKVKLEVYAGSLLVLVYDATINDAGLY